MDVSGLFQHMKIVVCLKVIYEHVTVRFMMVEIYGSDHTKTDAEGKPQNTK